MLNVHAGSRQDGDGQSQGLGGKVQFQVPHRWLSGEGLIYFVGQHGQSEAACKYSEREHDSPNDLEHRCSNHMHSGLQAPLGPACHTTLSIYVPTLGTVSALQNSNSLK